MDPKELAEMMELPPPVWRGHYSAGDMYAYALAHLLAERNKGQQRLDNERDFWRVEGDKWRAALAESCDDFRSDMLGEAGSSGGCSRAVTAEAQLAKLRAAALEVIEFNRQHAKDQYGDRDKA